MEWTKPGWIEAVVSFSLTEARSPARQSDTISSLRVVQGTTNVQAEDPQNRPPTVPLHVPQLRRETTPSLAVNEALKNRLIWAAVDTGQTLEEFLHTLLDLYLIHRKDPNTITVLKRAVRIADHLQLAEVEVAALQGYVATEATLRRAGLWMDDVSEALQLLPLLEGLPQSWTWKQAQKAMRAVAYVLRQGIDANHLDEFLAFHHALARCGINEKYLVDLVTALGEAGVHGSRKKKTLDRLIVQAAQQVDVEDLQQQAQGLAAEIERLEAQRQNFTRSIEEGQRRIEGLREQETALRDRLDALAGEVAGYEHERTMLQAARLLVERGEAHAPTSFDEAQPSRSHEPHQQSGHAQSAASPYGQWLDQLLSALQQCGGESDAGSETGNT
jgi:hypothetical protein